MKNLDKTMVTLAAFLFLITFTPFVYASYDDEPFNKVFFNSSSLARVIETGEPYTLSTVIQLVDDLFEENIKKSDDMRWEDDRRSSFSTKKGKLVYNKLSGTFKYRRKDSIRRYVSQCDDVSNHLHIAENVLNNMQTVLPEFSEDWLFIQSHRIIADSGTVDGPNNDDIAVLYEYRFSRVICGTIPSIGPSSETRIYLSPCGELKAIKVNWRRLSINDNIDFRLISSEDVAEILDEYRNRFLLMYGGAIVDEEVHCGYYEPENEEFAKLLQPVCIYSATHSRSSSSDVGTVSPIQYIVPLVKNQ